MTLKPPPLLAQTEPTGRKPVLYQMPAPLWACLGMTADQVADTLAANGVGGCRDADRPLSPVDAFDALPDRLPALRNQAVEEFEAAFFAGLYPDLERTPWVDQTGTDEWPVLLDLWPEHEPFFGEPDPWLDGTGEPFAEDPDGPHVPVFLVEGGNGCVEVL